jgi:AcrR family transcriptional regulator
MRSLNPAGSKIVREQLELLTDCRHALRRRLAWDDGGHPRNSISAHPPCVVYAVVIAVMRHAATIREAQPRRFVVHNTYEQIQLAAVRVVAAKGYHETSVRDICAAANISARSFHEHFSSKEEAVFSGVEVGADRVMGFSQQVYKSSPSWPDAIWDGMYAYAEWAKHEPAFARTGIVELLSVGPTAHELVKSLMDAFSIFLQPGYDLLEPSAAGSLDQAVTQRFFELLYLHITEHSIETVSTIIPELVRTILTPFMGPQATEQFIARREATTRRGSA